MTSERLTLLSPRERQVIDLVAAGLRTAEIADRLELSRATVETHIRAVVRKLAVRTRLQAVALVTGTRQPGPRTAPISPGDLEPLELLRVGHTIGEAAATLSISRRTVDRRLARVRGSLGVHTTAEAVAVLYGESSASAGDRLPRS